MRFVDPRTDGIPNIGQGLLCGLAIITPVACRAPEPPASGPPKARVALVLAGGVLDRLPQTPRPPSDPTLVDAARLRQILVNVIGNAIKFTNVGSVTVIVDAPAGSPYVDIVVRDTGIGIPLHRREFLFQKFSQADASMTRRFGGSGLGLVIVKELVEMMGGTVAIESQGENLGTTVTVSIARGRSTDS